MALISLIISIVAASISFVSYQLNKKQIRISHTPILLPEFDKKGQSSYSIRIHNKSNGDTLKSVNFLLKKSAKLTKNFSIDDEFLCPGWSTRELIVDEDLDGASFVLEYEGVVGSKIKIEGNIHFLSTGQRDLQNIKLTWG